VLPPCFFTLCLNVKRGLTGRGVHLLVAWLLVLANVSGTLTDAIANPPAKTRSAGRAFTLPAKSISNEKRILLSVGREPLDSLDWPV